MSRFFRSADSDSDSSSPGDTDSDDDNVEQTHQDSQVVLRDSSHANTAGESLNGLASDSRSSHRDLLLHALLEERCIRQARDDLGQAVSARRVRQHAQVQYQSLSQRLAAYGLVAPGMDNAGFSTQRQAVRDGLDTLSSTHTVNGNTSNELVLRRGEENHPLPQLEMSFDSLPLLQQQDELPWLIDLPRPADFSDALLPTLNTRSLISTNTTFFGGSRYQREFEELCVLGRGGYGIVYRCKHRFDGISYAVKKIPLSTSRLRRIRDRGQAGIDGLLLELTTLARLDHPNIVRYFGGWIEYATLQQHGSSPIDQTATFETSQHMGRSSTPPTPRSSAAEVSNDFISFESSASRASGAEVSIDSAETLQRQSTRDTQATVSDEEIESIDRSISASLEHSTLSNFVDDASPCLALHIQMRLYPITLADYIANTHQSSKHCFHIEPSVRILSALVDGIVYLHSQGIVHRDIKPANVFLSEQQQKHNWCSQCSPVSLGGLKVQIGDFGLVAALAHTEGDDMTTPVGTELYRPQSAIDRSRLEALDWFALGMMAFELVWPFSTRMERHETLSALKAGVYPAELSERIGTRTNEVLALIEYLLRSAHTVGSGELQSLLHKLLDSCV